MPNLDPNPSLTPEEAAEAYAASLWPYGSTRQHTKENFLAGHAHATASLSARLKEVERERDDARDACAWVLADPASIQSAHSLKVIRGHRGADTIAPLRAQVARLTEDVKRGQEAYSFASNERDRLRAELESVRSENVKLQEAVDASAFSVSSAMMEVRIAQLSRVNARLNRELTEAQKTVQLQWNSERERKQKLSVAEAKKLEALAVVEKMRAALELWQHTWLENGSKYDECMAASDKAAMALSTPPSLALLEFAEKFYAEAWQQCTPGDLYDPRFRSHVSDWLASDIYRALTRATGEAKTK